MNADRMECPKECREHGEDFFVTYDAEDEDDPTDCPVCYSEEIEWEASDLLHRVYSLAEQCEDLGDVRHDLLLNRIAEIVVKAGPYSGREMTDEGKAKFGADQADLLKLSSVPRSTEDIRHEIDKLLDELVGTK